jgi:hypothetical protein
VSGNSEAIFQPAPAKTGRLLHPYIFHPFTASNAIKTGVGMTLGTDQNPENCIFNL